MMHSLLIFILIRVISQGPISSTESLIKAMKARYEKTWYQSVTFTQRTVNHHPDGSKEEAIWYESMKIPSQLRIEFAPVDSGNGLIFARDSIFVFERQVLKQARPLIHSLLLLGFDAYGLPAGETIAKLRTLKYDLSAFHEDVWQGRPAYVVGADKGNSRSKQFWIDKERLVFVRSIEPSTRDSSVVIEIQFNDYRKLGGGWIAAEVLFYRGGKLATEEYYSDIKRDVHLEDKLFDPKRWKEAKHQ